MADRSLPVPEGHSPPPPPASPPRVTARASLLTPSLATAGITSPSGIASIGIAVSELDQRQNGIVLRQHEPPPPETADPGSSSAAPGPSNAGSSSSASGAAVDNSQPRNPMSRGSAIWRGELAVRGASEEVKVDIIAYCLGNGPTDRPSWPNTLVCDSRGLQNSSNASYMASKIRNPAMAFLQALSANGEEVVDKRLDTVAKMIEERGAAFERILEGYMVMAARDENDEVGLYILYERV